MRTDEESLQMSCTHETRKDISKIYNHDIEFLSEQRRIRITKLSKHSCQQVYVEHVGEYVTPVSADLDDSALESLLHRLPNDVKISPSFDYNRYKDACLNTNRRYSLVSVIPSDNKLYWMCYGRKLYSMHQRTRSRWCSTINRNDSAKCCSCGNFNNTTCLRKSFQYLQRISRVVEERRGIIIDKMRVLDKEITKSEDVVKSSIKMYNNGEVKQSSKLVSPLAKNVLDIDIVQDSVLQRIEVQAIVPILETAIAQKKESLYDLWEELIISTQHVFALAIVHIQKIARGFLEVRRLKYIRSEYDRRRKHFAAVEVQRVSRCFLENKVVQKMIYLRKFKATLIIQCNVRRKLATLLLKNLARDHFTRMSNNAAITIQSKFRSYRLVQLESQQRLLMEREEEKRRMKTFMQRRDKSAVTLQRFARGMLSRRILHFINVEKNIHHRVRYLSEKLLLKGHVFQFLDAISSEFYRLENSMVRVLIEESENASIFMDEVSKNAKYIISLQCGSYGNIFN